MIAYGYVPTAEGGLMVAMRFEDGRSDIIEIAPEHAEETLRIYKACGYQRSSQLDLAAAMAYAEMLA